MKFLVVVDMQNDFVDGALGTKEAQNIVPKVVKKIHSFHGGIMYTQDTHDPNYLNTQVGSTFYSGALEERGVVHACRP